MEWRGWVIPYDASLEAFGVAVNVSNKHLQHIHEDDSLGMWSKPEAVVAEDDDDDEDDSCEITDETQQQQQEELVMNSEWSSRLATIAASKRERKEKDTPLGRLKRKIHDLEEELNSNFMRRRTSFFNKSSSSSSSSSSPPRHRSLIERLDGETIEICK